MTCPGCSRDGVALIGGFCGHCSSHISGAVQHALDEVDLDTDYEIYDVGEHKDGFVHILLYDPEEGVPDL